MCCCRGELQRAFVPQQLSSPRQVVHLDLFVYFFLMVRFMPYAVLLAKTSAAIEEMGSHRSKAPITFGKLIRFAVAMSLVSVIVPFVVVVVVVIVVIFCHSPPYAAMFAATIGAVVLVSPFRSKDDGVWWSHRCV